MSLPIALRHEPIVDAIFEVRFNGNPHLAEVLPGLLFGQLEPKPQIHRQPAADIPEPIRASNNNFWFAPISRLELENFSISIGDRNIIIGCKLPYPKWPAFKRQILDVTKLMVSVGFEEKVERFSIKYVNLISAPTFERQISKIDIDLRLGSLEVTESHLNLQIHEIEDGIVHILGIITGASGKVAGGETTSGVVVDIDSIRNINPVEFQEFVNGLAPELENLRQSNKQKFFDCLKSETIKEMGPIYE